MSGLVELALSGGVERGGVEVGLVVVRGDGDVHRVVGALVGVVGEVLGGDDVAGVVLGADAGVDVDAVKDVAEQTQGEVGLDGGVLGDGARIALGDGRDGVGVGVVAEGRDAVVLGPGVEHGHAHAVVVGDDDVDLVAEGGGPGLEGVARRGGVPGGAGLVLHLLRGELADDVLLAVISGDLAVDDEVGGAVGVGADGVGDDVAVLLDGGAESLAGAAGTGDGVVVTDVTDGEDVADDAVAVAVERGGVLLDVVKNHLALEVAALRGVKADVVGVLVEVEGGHVELARGGVGRLTVEEDDGLGSVAGGSGVAALLSGLLGGLATAADERDRAGTRETEAAHLHEVATSQIHGRFPFPVSPGTRPSARP